VRLALHVAVRARDAAEDPRYRDLLARAPGSRNRYALRVVYLPQLLILWVASLPVQAGMVTSVGAGPVTVAGAVVWLAGFVFETAGDWQLARFRADHACMWWGLFGIGYGAAAQLITVVSPVLMTVILTRGTGQRMTERRMADGRPGYADYVARTSGFIPLPPRRTLGRGHL